MDEGDPGHQLMSEQEIVEAVLHNTDVDDDDDESDTEASTSFHLKLSTARDHLDELLHLLDVRPYDFNAHQYNTLREIRRTIIELQHSSGKQTKIDSFFRSRTPTPTTSPLPSTSGLQPPQREQSDSE